ncbi:MAG TPA: hypothetical protein VI136_08860 [Verrucomicrobiae bacterium]
MKPQDTVPALAAFAPIATIAPPLIVGGLLGLGLLWLLSSDKGDDAQPRLVETPPPDGPTEPPDTAAAESSPEVPPVSVTPEPTEDHAEAKPKPPTAKRVTREDLAEALAYGERQFTRKEVVAALEALGFRKTAAYKALSPDGKFGSLIEYTPDGLIGWNG